MVLCQANSYLNLNCADTRNICKLLDMSSSVLSICTFQIYTYIDIPNVLSSAQVRCKNYSMKRVCQQDLCEGLKLFKISKQTNKPCKLFLCLIPPISLYPNLINITLREIIPTFKINYLTFIKIWENLPYLELIFLKFIEEKISNWVLKR